MSQAFDIEVLRDAFMRLELSGRRMSARKYNGPQEFHELRGHLKAIIDEYEGACCQYLLLVEQAARSALDGRIRRFCENLGIGVTQALDLLREADAHIQCITQDNMRNVAEYAHDIREDLLGGFTRLEEYCSGD